MFGIGQMTSLETVPYWGGKTFFVLCPLQSNTVGKWYCDLMHAFPQIWSWYNVWTDIQLIFHIYFHWVERLWNLRGHSKIKVNDMWGGHFFLLLQFSIPIYLSEMSIFSPYFNFSTLRIKHTRLSHWTTPPQLPKVVLIWFTAEEVYLIDSYLIDSYLIYLLETDIC